MFFLFVCSGGEARLLGPGGVQARRTPEHMSLVSGLRLFGHFAQDSPCSGVAGGRRHHVSECVPIQARHQFCGHFVHGVQKRVGALLASGFTHVPGQSFVPGAQSGRT